MYKGEEQYMPALTPALLSICWRWLSRDLARHTWLWWDRVQLSSSLAECCVKQVSSLSELDKLSPCQTTAPTSTSAPVSSIWIVRTSESRKRDWHQTPTHGLFRLSGSPLVRQGDAPHDVFSVAKERAPSRMFVSPLLFPSHYVPHRLDVQVYSASTYLMGSELSF